MISRWTDYIQVTLSEKRALILSLLDNCDHSPSQNPSLTCALKDLLSLPVHQREQHIQSIPEEDLTRYVHQHVRHRASRVIATLEESTTWAAVAPSGVN